MALQIKKYAVLITILSLITQFIRLCVEVSLHEEEQFLSNKTMLKIGEIVITALVLLIVAIPEGLPLAVSISMALSIDYMKKDSILIKNVESVQTCAMLDELCVSKTGTLTKGDLNVAKVHFKRDDDAEADDIAFDNGYFAKCQAVRRTRNLDGSPIRASKLLAEADNENLRPKEQNQKRKHETLMFDQLGDIMTSNFISIIKECIIACSDVRIEINDHDDEDN